MTKNEFESDIFNALKTKPLDWRDGQFVFNYLYSKYPKEVSIVQFKHGIDCFYNGGKIKDFIDCCYKIITNDIDNNGL